MRYYVGEFWRAAELLRTHIPTSMPVRIRTVAASVLKTHHGEPCYGDCQAKKGYYLIRIARGMSLDVARDALLHEYAHCVDWDSNPREPREYHRDSWGLSYARSYKVVFGT